MGSQDVSYEDQIAQFDFKSLIKEEFKQRVTKDRQLKDWNRASRHLLSSVADVLDTATEKELKRDRTLLGNVSQKYVFNICSYLQTTNGTRIIKHLKSTRFPVVTDESFDRSSVKRKQAYLDKVLARTSKQVEQLEVELAKEKKRYKEHKQYLRKLQYNIQIESDEMKNALKSQGIETELTDDMEDLAVQGALPSTELSPENDRVSQYQSLKDRLL